MSSKTEEFRQKINLVYLFFVQHGRDYWKHYKGGIYSVDDCVIDTTTGEVSVLYHRVDGPEFDGVTESDIRFARPFSEWNDEIIVSNGDVSPSTVKRFTPVRKSSKPVWIPK